MRLPKGRPLLQNAKLEYINFDNILADAKKERASKISGYLEIIYPDGTEFLFLRHGEPFNAARFTREGRVAKTIHEVVHNAKTASGGMVNLYETSEELVAMVVMTLTAKPMFKGAGLGKINVDALFEKLQKSRFHGFLELRKGVELSYVRFKDGEAVKGFFIAKPEVPLTTPALRDLFSALGPGETLLIDAYQETQETAFEQATPAMVTLFQNTINRIAQDLADVVGPALVKKILEGSRANLAARYPFLKDFKVEGNGTVTGNTLTSPATLAKAFAEWTDSFAESFRSHLGKRLEPLIKNALRDYRFALKSTGFVESSKLSRLMD
jgi:hypothetical protein